MTGEWKLKTNRVLSSSLKELDTRGYGARVLPPRITRADFDRVLLRARPTVSVKDLEAHQRFTQEFGEEG